MVGKYLLFWKTTKKRGFDEHQNHLIGFVELLNKEIMALAY